MRQINIEQQLSEIEFVNRAKECFKESAKIRTYTDSGTLEEGELFAMKWGLGDDCIVVFYIGSEPINYTQVI